MSNFILNTVLHNGFDPAFESTTFIKAENWEDAKEKALKHLSIASDYYPVEAILMEVVREEYLEFPKFS